MVIISGEEKQINIVHHTVYYGQKFMVNSAPIQLSIIKNGQEMALKALFVLMA